MNDFNFGSSGFYSPTPRMKTMTPFSKCFYFPIPVLFSHVVLTHRLTSSIRLQWFSRLDISSVVARHPPLPNSLHTCKSSCCDQTKTSSSNEIKLNALSKKNLSHCPTDVFFCTLTIHPSIHFLPLNPSVGSRGAGAYPSSLRAIGGVHPG